MSSPWRTAKRQLTSHTMAITADFRISNFGFQINRKKHTRLHRFHIYKQNLVSYLRQFAVSKLKIVFKLIILNHMLRELTLNLF